MRKIALTGNIASGKSEVQKILVSLGYKVLDTDIVGHELLHNNTEVKNAFAEYDIIENNEISREKLGKVVFSDEMLLKKLNSIIHPQIKNKIEDFFSANENEEKVFVAIPLLFETNMQDMFDEIIFVYADDDLRLKRLMTRNNFDKDYAQKRIDSQSSQNEKINKSHIIIHNNGSLEDLKEKTYNMFIPVQKS